MTTLTDAQRQRLTLAVHEAGHAVIGVLHGASLIQASLTDDGQHGRCSFTGASFNTAGPATYRHHIACAGAVAAAMFTHGPRPTLYQVDALLHGQDRRELEIVAMATERRDPLPVDPVLRLLSQSWEAVSELTAELYLGGAITHDDVCRALGVRDGGGPHSVGLALLRTTA